MSFQDIVDLIISCKNEIHVITLIMIWLDYLDVTLKRLFYFTSELTWTICS